MAPHLSAIVFNKDFVRVEAAADRLAARLDPGRVVLPRLLGQPGMSCEFTVGSDDQQGVLSSLRAGVNPIVGHLYAFIEGQHCLHCLLAG